MTELFKIAGVQMDVELGRKPSNLERILAFLKGASREGARLIIFPECALTGYCFESLEEAAPHAEASRGPSLERIAGLCRAEKIFAAVGFLESEADRIYNACALLGPDGVLGTYRKIHLPFLGVDRFATFGDKAFRVWEIGPVRLGMNICYDGSFPESARVMALDGADLVVLPTNWPPAAQCAAECMVSTRAMENNIYYAAVNRVGTERGFRFIGSSKICAPSGTVLAQASADREEILYAEIDPYLAREKHLVRVPGKHEIDRFADRRPEMYGRILDKPGA